MFTPGARLRLNGVFSKSPTDGAMTPRTHPEVLTAVRLGVLEEKVAAPIKKLAPR